MLRSPVRTAVVAVVWGALAASSCQPPPAAPAAPATPPAIAIPPPATSPAAAPAPAPLRLTILHTNDHHGHAWRHESDGHAWGSLATRAALVRRVRAEVEPRGGHVLLLDAGDVHTGTFCSDAVRAEVDVGLYRRLGYRAMALGNHEFDPPFDVLQAQAGRARFPFLGANVLRADTERPALGDVASWDFGGARVTALGLSPPDTPGIATHGDDPRLRFRPPVEAAAARVPALRAQARVLVGLFHVDLPVAEEVIRRVPGFDVVVTGHDHLPLEQPRLVDGTPIVQAGSDGRYLGRIDLDAPPRGPVVVRGARLYPITADLPEDPEVARTLAEERRRCGGDAVVGHAAVELKRSAFLGGTGSSTSLANLIADAFRSAGGSDVAFINRGGIRTSLPQGPITREKAHEILPFEDTLVVLEMRGEELRAIAAESARRMAGGAGVLLPAGLEIIKRGARTDVLYRGRPLASGARLTVTVSSFLARGGDGYERFARGRVVRRLDLSPEQALVDYLQKHDPVRPSLEPRLRATTRPGPSRLRGEPGSPPPPGP